MKKVDIVSRIADELDITRTKAEDAVNAILDEVKQALAEGESVIIRRPGAFQVREKNTRGSDGIPRPVRRPKYQRGG